MVSFSSLATHLDTAVSSSTLCVSDPGTEKSSTDSNIIVKGPMASVSLPNISQPEADVPWLPKNCVSDTTISKSNNDAPKQSGELRQQKSSNKKMTHGTSAQHKNQFIVAGEKLAEFIRLCNLEYTSNETYSYAINALIREIYNEGISTMFSPPDVTALMSNSSEKESDVFVSSTVRVNPVMPPPPPICGMFTMSRRIPIPKNPCFNLIGRILGPRGLTVRELEIKFQCRIYVRGQGSIRDPKKAERLANVPGWEHLKEELHLFIIAGGNNQSELKCRIETSVSILNRLLHPQCFDVFKRRQLISLALMNGTFRQGSNQSVHNEATTKAKIFFPLPHPALAFSYGETDVPMFKQWHPTPSKPFVFHR